MRKILLMIALACSLAACGGKQERQRYEEYMQRFPESSLQDVYKWSFQDVFGPAHLVTDVDRATTYIRQEVAAIQYDTLTPRYDYTGPEGRYVRVNLSVVADSMVSAEQLADAVVRSSSVPPAMSVEQWRGQWHRYLRVLRSINPRPLNFDADEQKIDSLLQEGQYVVHHSRHFNETYSYSYRIITREIFEDEIRPLIEQK